MNTCRLCSDGTTTAAHDQPLFESTNFAVLPSLGALIEGWLLLIPKNHFICVGSLPESLEAEFQQLKRVAISFVEEVYGTACAFEHGPHQENRKVGCGVDHAHLHILPARFDLLAAATPFVPTNTQWVPGDVAECRTAYSELRDYLYFEQDIGNGYIAVHDSFDSQVFRRGIAQQLNLSDEYDWREFPNFGNIERTIQRARQWCSQPSAAASKLEAAA